MTLLNIIRKRDRVALKTFCSSEEAPQATNVHENYWGLIGKTGQVLEIERRHVEGDHDSFALVQFDDDPANLGLECHNSVEKSLWIRISDLERENST